MTQPAHHSDPSFHAANGDDLLTDSSPLLTALRGQFSLQDYQKHHWMGSFGQYLEMVREDRTIARTSHQRIYDMIMSYGTHEYEEFGERLIHYNFFDDPTNRGKNAVFGLDRQLMDFVKYFEAAAHGLGAQKRILLLQGPVGSAKSTVVTLLKEGLERYSRTDEGALYTFGFTKEPGSTEDISWSSINQDPLTIIPKELRDTILRDLNEGLAPGERAVKIRGSLSPDARREFEELIARYDGDIMRVFDHVVVRRITLSEEDRRGIGTVQPKDEKSQDATELTGEINFHEIAKYGSSSDPRAFDFDGELLIANRGLVELQEMLKMQKEMLYVFLSAAQEQVVKVAKFPQIDTDVAMIAHTNEPEFERLQGNRTMEAIIDRMFIVYFPYPLKLSDNVKIYDRDFGRKDVQIYIAPHTLEVAAMFSVLTRLTPPSNQKLSMVQKLRLYDGKSVAGFTDDTVIELKKEGKREGHSGISPRFIQDMLNKAIVMTEPGEGINPFIVLETIRQGLERHPLITRDEEKRRFRLHIEEVNRELEDTLKMEVQRAIAADEDALARLCNNYLQHAKAYTRKEKIENRFTKAKEDPDESLMRAIEEKLEPPVPASAKDEYRNFVMQSMGALAMEGRKFDFTSDERLRKALEKKLFEDIKDTINFARITEDENSEQFDLVVSRLMRNFGYNEENARHVLEYVSGIFRRGDSKPGK